MPSEMRCVSRVEADDLHLDVSGRSCSASDGWLMRFQRDVGDVQQAVDAAEVDERAVVGDVLDHAVEDLAFLQRGRPARCAARRGSLRARRGARRRCCRAAVHLEDRERLRRWPISGPTSRTGRMSTWLPGRKATAPPRSTVKPPLTRPKIAPMTRSFCSLKRFSRRVQASSRRALSRDRTASPCCSPSRSRKTSTLSPTLTSGGWPPAREFLERDAAFGLQADIDHDEVVLDRDHAALDDGAFEAGCSAERLVEQRGEVVADGPVIDRTARVSCLISACQSGSAAPRRSRRARGSCSACGACQKRAGPSRACTSIAAPLRRWRRRRAGWCRARRRRAQREAARPPVRDRGASRSLNRARRRRI